jgi:hypothetical protein
MSINRSAKKLIALALASAAVAAATQSGTQAVGARPVSRAVNADPQSHGYPDAVPPILRPARPSELTEMRRAQAQERKALIYRLPLDVRYSNAEMNVFASEGYGRA